MARILPDCCELFEYVEEALKASRVAQALGNSRMGKIVKAANAQEGTTVLFTAHTVTTAAFTLNKKGVCSEEVAVTLLTTLRTALENAGLASYDDTIEDYAKCKRQAQKGRCDGDWEDSALLDALKRSNEVVPTTLYTNDSGAFDWAKMEHQMAVLVKVAA